MNRTSIFKGMTGAILMVGALGLASQASAYTFDVCEAGGFTTAPDANDDLNGIAAPNNSVGDASCIAAAGTNTGVEWFAASPDQSSVVIDFKAFTLDLDLTLDSDMDMGIIATITQVNNEIFSRDSIDDLQGFPYTHLMVGAGNFMVVDEANNIVLGDPAAFFSIEHTETSNIAVNCPSTETVSPKCEDQWAFTIVPPPGTSVDFFLLDQPDFIFTASFDLVVELPNVVIGNTVYTPETQPGESSVDVKFSISSQRIPEPGTLALLGLGLAGIGFAGRRKRA